VPLLGAPERIAILQGNWSGTYDGNESHRRGTISLSIGAGDTVAYGDVLMIPAGYDHHDVWTERDRHATMAARHPAILSISFVRISANSISGVLEPYVDPDCDCRVLTRFAGRLTNPNTIEGTFVTTEEHSAAERRGRWRVTRKSVHRP
jgi:hypothetical protein